MLKEFKEFVAKGNVIDLAVGVIIGAAFGKIVTSLVEDVIMPPIGLVLGKVDFSDLYINLSGQSYPSLEAAKAASAPTLNYGMFINTLINFLIVAIAIFVVVKAVNKFRRKQEDVTAPTAQEKLLTDIRDLLAADPGRAASAARVPPPV